MVHKIIKRIKYDIHNNLWPFDVIMVLCAIIIIIMVVQIICGIRITVGDILTGS